MKAWDIAFKDMRQSFRNRGAIIFMFVIPVLVTVLFYFMFGSIAGDDGDFTLAQTAVVVVNQDEGELAFQSQATNAGSMGEFLLQALQGEGVADLLAVTEMADVAAARAAVDRQEAGVAVIIPPVFTAALTEGGAPAAVELYNDPTLTIGPAIVASVVGQIVDGMAAATIGVEVTLQQLAEAGATISPQLVQAVVNRYAAGGRQQQAGQPVTLQAPPARQGQANELAQILSLVLGGMLVFYAFFTGANVLQTILTEQEAGTLQRLFTTPTPQLTIFSGKFLAALLILTVQVAVLLTFGRLVFGIRWGQPLPLSIAAAGIVIIAATSGLFLVSLLKRSRQAGIIFGGLLTLTGMLGLFPAFTAGSPNTPPALNTLSLLVPQGWAIRGLRQSMDGRPLTDVVLTFAIVLLWSAVFFFIGQRRLRHRFA